MRGLIGLLFAVTLAIQLVTPRIESPLHLPAPQVVQTRNPKVGVHLRLAGTGNEELAVDQLSAVREMGASFVVDLFPWAHVQPASPRTFEWRGADLLIEHALRQGLQVVARLDIVPAWARPSGTNTSYLDPAHYGDFARYAAAFAERYRNRVHYIQIWNEPNLHLEWGLREPDPYAYATLLREVWSQVKAVNPDVRIVAGNLSPGHAIPATRVHDLDYLKGMINAGAPFDVLGVHAYGARAPAIEEPHPDRVNFRRVEVYRDVLRQLRQTRPMIVTEGGWNDHPRWNGAVRPSQRINWTVDAYRLSETWPDVLAVCLWQWQLPEWQLPSSQSYQDNWTFLAGDGSPKPLYYAVQRYARDVP